MNKNAMEFIGTFFLVFTVGMTVLEPGAGPLAPLAIGSVLMVMVYAGKHISGGHYNPAVTVAVALRGRCSNADAVAYVLVQVVAALLAATVVRYLKPDLVLTPIVHDIAPSLLAEFLLTFALCFVFLITMTAKATEGNAYFGVAVGATVMAGGYAVANVSGGAFNPAAAVGMAYMGIGRWADIWIYVVACFLGGGLAAWAFRSLHPEDV